MAEGHLRQIQEAFLPEIAAQFPAYARIRLFAGRKWPKAISGTI